MKLKTLKKAAKKYRTKNPELRKGQSISIILKDMNSEAYDEIQGTVFDPYHVNANLPYLYRYLKENHGYR